MNKPLRSKHSKKLVNFSYISFKRHMFKLEGRKFSVKFNSYLLIERNRNIK
jgi:hypothetical protein